MSKSGAFWALALGWSVLGLGVCVGEDIEFVTVGDPGNAPFMDFYNYTYVYTNGAWVYSEPEVASLDYVYRIGKYEITQAQYLEFLNNVDPSATNILGLFHPSTPPIYGDPSFDGCDFVIDLNQSEGQRYSLIHTNQASFPVWGVTWYAAARFCNWLHNGKGGPGSTEGDATNGAYDTRYFDDGITTNDPPTHNSGARFWVPTFDEWFKAAYYKGGSTNAGYWTNPFQHDGEPHGVLPTDEPNTCNIYDRRDPRPPCPEARVAVGSYPNSLSPYGCLDMGGNGNEWSEHVEANYTGALTRRVMGGAFYWLTDHPTLKAQLTFSTHRHPPTDWWNGMRIAALPEAPDHDGDGIPDSEDPDDDNDGMLDIEEDIAGTDPRLQRSVFSVQDVSFPLDTRHMTLSFLSVTGRVYDVLYNDDLLDPAWQVLTNDLQGAGGLLEVADPGAASRRFYRIQVKLP